MTELIHLLLALIMLAPVGGELAKFSLSGFDVAPADFLIPALFIVWAIDKIRRDRVIRLGRVGRMILVFVAVMIVSYVINLFRFPLREMISAGAYLVRFALYISLALMTHDLLARDKTGRTLRVILGSMIAGMVLIVFLGFLQLIYFPSFLELGLYIEGWDPHIGRLLSTWFDPNFIGAYLSLMLGITVALTLYFHRVKNRRWFSAMAVITALGLVAMYLTYSRSGYLGLIFALVIFALFKSRKILVATVLMGLIAFTFSTRLQDRVMEAVDSGKTFLGLDSQFPLDPTAELRVYSWKFATEMIADHPWAGVGYSRYKYEINQRGHGLLSDHSVSGSDSSLLTLWATTGVFGLISFLAIGFVAAVVSVKRILKKDDFRSYLDAGLLGGFAGLMVSAVFVNALLFPLIMVYLWTGLGLMDE